MRRSSVRCSGAVLTNLPKPCSGRQRADYVAKSMALRALAPCEIAPHG